MKPKTSTRFKTLYITYLTRTMQMRNNQIVQHTTCMHFLPIFFNSIFGYNRARSCLYALDGGDLKLFNSSLNVLSEVHDHCLSQMSRV